VEVVALIRCVFLRLVAKMSDRFLEQRINISFWVTLEKMHTSSILSKAYGGEAMKMSGVSDWHKIFKEGR